MAVQTSQNEIQTAFYARLVPSGVIDSVLSASGVVGVFDFRNVPQNQPFDYITLGEGFELPNNTLGRRGYTYYPTIGIWSRSKGTDIPTAIVARINTLVDQKILTLSTHEHVSTLYQRATWLADPDGLTLHVALQYQLYTEE